MLRNNIGNPALDRYFKYFWVFFISTLAILVGGLIYVFIRPVEADFVSKLVASRAGEWIPDLRNRTLVAGQFLPACLVYSLPGGLWAFAYATIISGLWLKTDSLFKIPWLATIPLLVFGFEALQFFNMLPGTFSMADLFSGAMGMLAGCLCGFKIIQHKNTNDEKL